MSVQQNEFLTSAQLLQLAQRAMALYPAQYQGEIRLLCQSENATFAIQTAQARYALRIHRPNYHSHQAIESELDWLAALNESGIEVPKAIHSEIGQRVIQLQFSEHVHRYAVLFEWIDGTMPTVDVSPKSFEQLGQITARLHLHSKAWEMPTDFQRIIWNHDTMVGPQGHWGDWHDAPHLELKDHLIIEESLALIKAKLDGFGQSSDRYGLIHADLRLTNLLLNNQHIAVIDFDDCGMSWFMHDLAAAISFNEHYAAAPNWVEHWLKGYERVGHISDAEYALIPSFIMQRRIQMLAWNGSHASTEMALSLGNQWSNETIRLCKKYLRNQMPVGV
ncbi:Ser/Thr protein kinase RdoA (MazF antagonist) [Acinetobacter calcoaceticus]|uniref:Ser/Thr protein kinase RdoA (MazF antagonist) n=1 Tax=Acinetobacter calcoaceticus TaxID=471 RepID=A0A4R1XT68_ACICA|nr:Ser/Thr protein kinase RdoA (MazF antagonist) [Acinetobacter calcoaceticus]